MTHSTTPTAGIDTAKDKLDIAIHGHPDLLTVANARAGWRDLVRHLQHRAVSRVGIEASGGYERGVTQHLRKAGLTVLLLQPLQAKAFAAMKLRRAKNDRIDAGIIAACTALLDDPGLEHDPRMPDLADHLTFVEQIEDDIVRAKTRREHIHLPRLRGHSEREIKRLERLRRNELHRLEALLRAEADLAARLDLVRGIPGIGIRTAIALIVRMPELGRISREQAAALAGLAPFDDDSGRRKGLRHIAGGRARLRRALYAAALPAAFFWNPALKATYARLVAGGKPHKTALIACARKLLIFANTVLARGTPWQAPWQDARATARRHPSFVT